jgi:hypothetical protein
MDLAIEPDIYEPSIDDKGNYIDKLPSSMKHGIQCPCGARKEKVYETRPKLKAHIESKFHQKWIADLNINKANLYVRCIGLDETVKNQQIIIAQLQRQLDTKNKTIDILTDQLTKKSIPIQPAIDLLDFE